MLLIDDGTDEGVSSLPRGTKHTSHRNTYIYLTLVVLLGSIICSKSPSHYLACLSSTQARVDDIFGSTVGKDRRVGWEKDSSERVFLLLFVQVVVYEPFQSCNV